MLSPKLIHAASRPRRPSGFSVLVRIATVRTDSAHDISAEGWPCIYAFANEHVAGVDQPAAYGNPLKCGVAAKASSKPTWPREASNSLRIARKLIAWSAMPSGSYARFSMVIDAGILRCRLGLSGLATSGLALWRLRAGAMI